MASRQAFEQSLLYRSIPGDWAICDVYGKAFKGLPGKKISKNLKPLGKIRRTNPNAARLTSSLLDAGLSALAQAVDAEGSRVVGIQSRLGGARDGRDRWHLIPCKDIPALGYRTFPPPPPVQSKTLSGTTLEKRIYKGNARSCPRRDCVASREEYRPRVGRRIANTAWGNISTRDLKVRRQRSTAERINKADGAVIFTRMSKPGLPVGVRYRRASGTNGTMRLLKQGETLTGVLEMPGDLNNHLPALLLRVTIHKDVACSISSSQSRIRRRTTGQKQTGFAYHSD